VRGVSGTLAMSFTEVSGNSVVGTGVTSGGGFHNSGSLTLS
jgi:hypothetical protein